MLAGAGLAVTVFPNLDVGFVRIDRVDLAIAAVAGAGGPPALPGARIGDVLWPVGTGRLQCRPARVQLPVRFADGNAGPFDVGLEALLPTGLGLVIDAPGVVGGGFLRFDPQKEEYSGMLELQIAEKIAVKAIGFAYHAHAGWRQRLFAADHHHGRGFQADPAAAGIQADRHRRAAGDQPHLRRGRAARRA